MKTQITTQDVISMEIEDLGERMISTQEDNNILNASLVSSWSAMKFYVSK